MMHLSDRFAFGHGEPVDPLEAARWRFLAREGGDSQLPLLELIDAEGNVKAQDSLSMDELAKACSLFVRAVAQKSPDAAAALAKRYLEAGKPGEGVVLLRFAKRLGSASAAAELNKLEPGVAVEQQANASKAFPFLKE